MFLFFKSDEIGLCSAGDRCFLFRTFGPFRKRKFQHKKYKANTRGASTNIGKHDNGLVRQATRYNRYHMYLRISAYKKDKDCSLVQSRVVSRTYKHLFINGSKIVLKVYGEEKQKLFQLGYPGFSQLY